jgi:hypothetical protein
MARPKTAWDEERNSYVDEPPVPAIDEHLDDFGSQFEEGFDMNPIEQGCFDDDPNPFHGDYSEE